MAQAVFTIRLSLPQITIDNENRGVFTPIPVGKLRGKSRQNLLLDVFFCSF
jgi:hypothetical protein